MSFPPREWPGPWSLGARILRPFATPRYTKEKWLSYGISFAIVPPSQRTGFKGITLEQKHEQVLELVVSRNWMRPCPCRACANDWRISIRHKGFAIYHLNKSNQRDSHVAASLVDFTLS
jgi:hypothetical protein